MLMPARHVSPSFLYTPVILSIFTVNLRYTITPVAIAYPTTPEKVGAVVAAGAAQHYSVTARSGGVRNIPSLLYIFLMFLQHSYVAGGLGGEDGSLVVDLSNFKYIEVDEVANTVEVGSGNRLGDVALRLNDFGRALPHGRCTTVGYVPLIIRASDMH